MRASVTSRTTLSLDRASHFISILPSIRQRLRCLLCFITSVLAVAPISLSADPGGPFTTANYAPLVQIFALPPIPDLNVFKHKSSVYSLQSDVSSFFAETKNDREISVLDGESYRYTFTYSAKPKAGFHWKISIPYLKYRGGTIDGFIDEWHDIFGLPEGGRNLSPKDRQYYYYERDGQVLLDIQEQNAGISDTLISGQWLVSTASTGRYSLTANVKLPTGSSSELIGSGSIDLSVGLAGSIPGRLYSYDYNIFFSSGVMWVGKSYYLSELQQQIVAFGGLGASVSLYPYLHFKTQIDANSEFYTRTNLAEIGQEAVQITIGGEWQFSQSGRFDFGVSEDLLIDASPDVVFHSALYFKY